MIRLFPVFVPARILALLISDILLVIGSFVVASYMALPVDAWDYLRRIEVNDPVPRIRQMARQTASIPACNAHCVPNGGSPRFVR